MRKVFDKLHHHGKKVYRHAKKHHKKYLWGAAWFFWLFKLFSFLTISISGYIMANNNLLETTYIQIPGVITDQTNGEKIEFNLGSVDAKNIDGISFQMKLDTIDDAMDSYVSTDTNVHEKYIYTLNKWENDLRTVLQEDMPVIKDQLTGLDTSFYLEIPYKLAKQNIQTTLNVSYYAPTSMPTVVKTKKTIEGTKKWEIPWEMKEKKDKRILESHGFEENKKWEMIGSESLDMQELSWEITIATIIQSTGEAESNPAEVLLPQWLNIKTEDGKDFTWILSAPEIIDWSIINILWQSAISAVKIWSDTQSLLLKDGSWNASYATVKLPVSGLNIWDTINVYYTESWASWNYLTRALVTWTTNNTFVIFQTNHFTTFVLGGERFFNIENDDLTTANPSNVTLYNDANQESVLAMRFGNDEWSRDSATRETISDRRDGWTLADPETEGIKTVYAEFCAKGESIGTPEPCNGDNAYVTDYIIYNVDGPITSINSPGDNSQQWSSFNVDITDADAAWFWNCYYIVTNNWSPWAPISRTCNSILNVTECTTEWINVCNIEAYSIDIWLLTSPSAYLNNISIDYNAPTAPVLTCSDFTDNQTGTFAWAVTCSISDTAWPSARTAVAYSLNNERTDNANNTQYQFTPNIGTTVVEFRISDSGWWPTESNTYTIIKQESSAPDVPTLSCSDFTHNTRGNYGWSIVCNINDTASPSRTAVGYSTNSWVDRADNANSLTYNFTPSEWTTNLILRISSAWWTTNSNTYTIMKDATVPSTPTLSCTNLTHNTRGTYNWSITCSLGNDTSWPSPKTVRFSINNWGSWINNGDVSAYDFTPPNWETSVIGKISDIWWESSNSNTYILLNDTAPPDAPVLTCSNFTHNVWSEFTWETSCTINDSATPSPRTAVWYTINGWLGRSTNNNNLWIVFTPTTWQNNIIFRISDLWWWPVESNTYTILKWSPYVAIPASSSESEHINALTWMGYVAWSWWLEWARVWESSINFANASEWLVVPAIAIQSTEFNNDAVTVKIPGWTYFEWAGETPFTWVFLWPTVQDLSVASNISDQFIKAVVKIWSWWTINLKTSTWANAYATVRMPLTWVSIWETVTINYSSDDGASRAFLTSGTVAWEGNALYVEFTTNHFTSFSVWAWTRDNDYFLTGRFWSLGPSTGNIIRALYGWWSWSSERTAYTVGRNEVTCVTWSMSVVITWWSYLPASLIANTIYVLTSWSTTGIGVKVFESCTAIVWSGTVRLERARAGGQAAMRAISRKNIIVDNITINSTGYGGIWLNLTGSSNNTFNSITWYGTTWNFFSFFVGSYNFIHNSNIYSNSGYGIYFDAWSISGSVDTSTIHDNNWWWIMFNISNNWTVDSCELGGNNVGTYGIYVSWSNYITINWSSIHNSTSDGIHFDFSSSNGVITSTNSYSNWWDGIELVGGSNSTTLANNNIYSNTNIWLQINWSYATTIRNTQSYSNWTGIAVTTSSWNAFYDSQVYNNINKWIIFKDTNLSTLNNMNIFNNTWIGLCLDNNVSGFVLNNSLIYNNNDYGIYINTGTINNAFNNSMIYNNKLDGIYIKDSSTTKWYFHDTYVYNNSGYGMNFSPGGQSVFEFYWTLKLFANTNGNFSGTNWNDSVLSKHTASVNPPWSAWSLDTWTASMNCMYAGNPRNNSSTRLLASASCDTKWKIARTATQPVSYLYGWYVRMQQRPVYYDTSSGFIERYSPTPPEFIPNYLSTLFDTELWGDNLEGSTAIDGNPDAFTFIDNYAALKNTYYTSNIITLTGMLAWIAAPVAIDTWVLYKSWVNVWTYTTGQNGDTFYIGLTGSSADDVITSSTMTVGKASDTYSLRTTNPIAVKYYWPWSIYKTWRCTDSCDLSVMTVVTVTPSAINAFIASSGFNTANTVFVLSPWDYILTWDYYYSSWTLGPYGLPLTADCTAIIWTWWTGAVTFYSTWQKEGMIGIAAGRVNIIIDNIKIDGYNNGWWSTHTKNNNWIATTDDNHSSSIFNSEIYNEAVNMGNKNAAQGIYLRNISTCFTINNVKLYSWWWWIWIDDWTQHLINNVQIFNHYRDGIYIWWNYNSVNNYASYANDKWVEINWNYNIVNNAFINRANDWIFLANWSTYNKLNNIRFSSNYANGSAYWINAEVAITCIWNQYYGSIDMYQTDTSLYHTDWNDAVLSPGTWWFMWWTTGAITSTSAVSWSYFINPYDANTGYLFGRNSIWAFNQDFTYSRAGRQWVTYSYWWNIPLQAQPVWYTWASTDSAANKLIYNATKFVWGDTTKISWSMVINSWYYASGRNLVIVFTSAVAAEYRLLWTITGLNRTWTVSAGWAIVTWVVLSWNDWAKNVIVQLYTWALTWENRATHYADEVFMDITRPTVWTWYISSWATWFKSPTYYYKWTIDISWSVYDTGIWLNTWTCEFATWTTRSAALYSGSSTTWYCYKTWLTYTTNINIRFRIKDNLWTISTGGTWAYTYDATAPVVWTWFISSWSTWDNRGTLYYKWTINISWNVSDAWVGLSWTSCQYTTGVNWLSANYQTTSCQATGLVYTTGINIKFRIWDMLWNVGTGKTWTYIYDAIPPPIVTLLSPASGSTIYYFPTTSLLRSGSVDTGVGTSGYTYQVSVSSTFASYVTSWSVTVTWVTLNLANSTKYYWRVRAFDKLTNSWSWSATGNFTITPDPYVTYYFWLGASFTSQWNNPTACNTNIISVYYIPAWYNTGLLSSPQPNTIYVLADWVHTIDNTSMTFGWDCSAIVGSGMWTSLGNVTIYSSGTIADSMIKAQGRSNDIVDNIILDWEYGTGSSGSPHGRNYNGIEFLDGQSSSIYNTKVRYFQNHWIKFTSNQTYTTINNAEIFNNNDDWIHLSGSDYNIISLSTTYNNAEWIKLVSSDNNDINSHVSYSNGVNGIHIYNTSASNDINSSSTYSNSQNGIKIEVDSDSNKILGSQSRDNTNHGILIYDYSDLNEILSSQIYSNDQIGIQIEQYSTYNTISGSQVRDNTSNGIMLVSYADYNTIEDTQTHYNNDGIHISSTSNHNIINNTQSFWNASAWIYIFSNSDYNTINNSQTYNNNWDGIGFSNNSMSWVVNNTKSYLNGGDWLEIANSSDYIYINNFSSIENSNCINTSSAGNNNLYYWETTGTNCLVPGQFNQWTTSPPSLTTVRLNGNWTSISRKSWSNPYTDSFCDEITYSADTSRNRSQTSEYCNTTSAPWSSPGEVEGFLYWSLLPRQDNPTYYDSSNNLQNLWSRYNSSLAIAEFNALDWVPDTYGFSPITSASTGTNYNSDIVTVAWLWANVRNRFFIDNWTLYKNTVNVWTFATWTNGDELYIELMSSASINDMVTGNMKVWSYFSPFTILTTWATDTTPPVVSDWYISSWSTWDNWGTLYYKWTIDVRADVSDNFSLSWTSCQYTVDNWANRYTASYAGSSTAWYCEATGLTPGANIDIMFSMQDDATNITTGNAWTYVFDDTAPTVVTTVSPTSWDFILAWSTNLTWTTSTDADVGLSGYIYEISTWAGFTTLVTSGTVDIASKTIWWLVDGTTYYWRILAFDKLDNQSSWSNEPIFIVDVTAPTVWLPYISVWTTGTDWTDLFYRWTIDIRTDISDNVWLSGSSCEYSIDNWNSWSPGSYVAISSTTGYCEATVPAPNLDIQIKFRISDLAWYPTVSPMQVYIYDGVVPTVSVWYISLWSTGDNWGTLYYKWTINVRADVTDAKALSWGSCQYTTNNWGSRNAATYVGSSTAGYCEATGLTPGPATIEIKFSIQDTVWLVTVGNIWTYIYDNTAPTAITTASPTSGQVINSSTANLIRSPSTDAGVGFSGYTYEVSTWAGFTTLITSDTVFTNTDSIWALADNTTYYWRVLGFDKLGNQTAWSNIPNFTVDLLVPTVWTWYISAWSTWVDYATNLYYKWTITISWAVSDNVWLSWSSCQYTTNNWGSRSAATYVGSSTTGYCYVAGLTPNMDIQIKFRIRDNAWNITTGNAWIYFYDATAPTVWTWYISAWTTGVNWSTGYYKWTITISWSVSDAKSLNVSSCQYTTWGARAGASFGGSTTAGYCYVAGLTPTTTINIRFSMQDIMWNTTTGATWTYVYDVTWPPQVTTVSPTSGQTMGSWTVNLVRAVSTDTGVGTSGYTYQVSTWSTFTTFVASWSMNVTWVTITWLTNSTTYYWRVYAFDTFGNTWAWSATGNYTINIGWPPVIIFTWTTPASWATITGNSLTPKMQITETWAWLNQFIYTRSWTSYSIYDSWLVLMANFDNVIGLWESTWAVTWIVKDRSQNNYTWTSSWWILWTWNGRWNGGYIFDGVNDYISFGDIDALDGKTQITVAMRINITTKRSQQIFNRWAAHNTGGISIYQDSNYITFRVYSGRKPSIDYGSFTITDNNLGTGTWRFLVITADIAARTGFFYVDGINIPISGGQTQWNAGMPASFLPSADVWVLGMRPASPTYSLPFSGTIDELRLYNRVLTSSEVLQLWRSNFVKYDTGKWLYTDDRQCMVNGTYTYTWYVTNLLSLSDTTGRINTINIANRDRTQPAYYLGSTWYSSNISTLSGQFTGYFTVTDWKGTSWWYSTFQLPTRLTWVVFTGNYIDWSNIYLMATGVDVIEGNIDSSIYVTWSLGTYQSTSAPLQYIVRSYVSSQYSCPAGVYGNKPYIKVDIPANQVPDTYSGVLNINLYE